MLYTITSFKEAMLLTCATRKQSFIRTAGEHGSEHATLIVTCMFTLTQLAIDCKHTQQTNSNLKITVRRRPRVCGKCYKAIANRTNCVDLIEMKFTNKIKT